MRKIIPAILALNLDEFNEKLSKVESFSDTIQIDIADGDFVATNTVELSQIKSLPAGKHYEAHLMVSDPIDYFFHCKRLGIERIAFHCEVEELNEVVITKAKENGFRVFIAINPESEIILIEEHIKDVDGVLLMSVEPGMGGQKLIPSVLNKAKELREKYPELIIEMDGGINKENIGEVWDAGVNIAVIGSGILKAQDPQLAWKELNDLENEI